MVHIPYKNVEIKSFDAWYSLGFDKFSVTVFV
jgi:hypothetical protein